MRVLFVSHTSEVSGGERSLLTLIAALGSRVEAHLACPSGDLARRAAALGIPVSPLRGIGGGPRLGIASARAVAALLYDACRVAGVRRVDLIHANSVRAGLVSCVARAVGGAPVIAHVRDCYPPGEVLTSVSRLALAAGAKALVFNSGYTERCFMTGAVPLRERVRCAVVPNGVDLEAFTPVRSVGQARTELGLPTQGVMIGVIGQMTPWKGHDDAVHVLAHLLGMGHDARLLLVGSAKFVARAGRFDHPRYVAELHELVRRLGLQERVTFLGERDDVPRVLEALDVALVPSSQEPFGRGVIEAMAMARPVVATNVGGPAEIIRDGVDGVLLPPDQPAAWAEAVDSLLRRPERAHAMGQHGRQRVRERFTSAHHAALMSELYSFVLAA
jgi:L-malate glycosyltransferase